MRQNVSEARLWTRLTRCDSFMIDLMAYPEMIRNVMVAGHIHHGKTSLMDMLVYETHQLTWDADKQVG